MIDAFSNRSLATRHEAAIGAVMLRDARSEGRTGTRWPPARMPQTLRRPGAMDRPVLEMLAAGPRPASDVARLICRSDACASSLLRRLLRDGRVERIDGPRVLWRAV